MATSVRTPLQTVHESVATDQVSNCFRDTGPNDFRVGASSHRPDSFSYCFLFERLFLIYTPRLLVKCIKCALRGSNDNIAVISNILCILFKL